MPFFQKIYRTALLLSLMMPNAVIAAEKTVFFGDAAEQMPGLKNFSVIASQKVPKGVVLPKSILKNTPDTLRLLKAEKDPTTLGTDARYAQFYQNIPVYGYQVIYHVLPNGHTLITGMVINGIEQDVKTLQPTVSVEKATHIVNANQAIKSNLEIKKIIYFNSALSHKAVLAYYITYLSLNSGGPAAPVFIVDANSGKIIQQWDNVMHADSSQVDGTGPGGLNFTNQNCPGSYYFGAGGSVTNVFSSMNTEFDNTNTCVLRNQYIQVFNLNNKTTAQLPFSLPVSSAAEASNNLSPFNYTCAANTNFVNATDGGTSPVNDGFSPANETLYFATQTIQMYINHYGVSNPFGTKDLPIHAYTHIADYENAFAFSGDSVESKNLANGGNDSYTPQQVVFGNGGSNDAPETDVETVGHEMSHLVTAHASGLVYADQSGGMNESFSDAAAFALKYYLRNSYPFVWQNQTDWRFGFCISKIQKTLRYLNNPPEDGNSIDNPNNYTPGMDTHYSSGIFNKAYYVLSTTAGWNPDMAFRIYLNANLHYWIPNSTFSYGACGVIQSAVDLNYKSQDVINAFSAVNVQCKVGGKLVFKK